MPLPESPIMFANNPLDRAGHLRGNPDWLAAQFADDSAAVCAALAFAALDFAGAEPRRRA